MDADAGKHAAAKEVAAMNKGGGDGRGHGVTMAQPRGNKITVSMSLTPNCTFSKPESTSLETEIIFRFIATGREATSGMWRRR